MDSCHREAAFARERKARLRAVAARGNRRAALIHCYSVLGGRHGIAIARRLIALHPPQVHHRFTYSSTHPQLPPRAAPEPRGINQVHPQLHSPTAPSACSP